MVAPLGLEPRTSGLWGRRAASCSTALCVVNSELLHQVVACGPAFDQVSDIGVAIPAKSRGNGKSFELEFEGVGVEHETLPLSAEEAHPIRVSLRKIIEVDRRRSCVWWCGNEKHDGPLRAHVV